MRSLSWAKLGANLKPLPKALTESLASTRVGVLPCRGQLKPKNELSASATSLSQAREQIYLAQTGVIQPPDRSIPEGLTLFGVSELNLLIQCTHTYICLFFLNPDSAKCMSLFPFRTPRLRAQIRVLQHCVKATQTGLPST